jgi:RND superfamily putative drug exporter
VAVFVRETGLSEADHRHIASNAGDLEGRRSFAGWQVHSTANSPHLKSLLNSPDGKAALIVVDLPAELLTHHTIRRVREIQRVLAERSSDDGLSVHVTGSAALGELLDSHTKTHIQQTKLWALGAVAAILLFIYRSPVAMFLPLLTVTVALMVILGLVGWAASAWLPMNGLVEIFIIILVGGSGVDYCLFLFARFREELVDAPNGRAALVRAAGRSGGAIVAGSATNAAGLLCLWFADNRDLYTSGPTIAFALIVLAFVVLTLTPALMGWAGRFLVWPQRLLGESSSRFWRWMAGVATRYPGRIVVLLTLCLIPPALLALRAESLYDAFEEYPADAPYVRGAKLYYRHFFDAEGVSELSLVISADRRLDSPDGLRAAEAAADALAGGLMNRFPIVYFRDIQDPLGAARRPPNSGETLADKLLAEATRPWAAREYIGRSALTMRIDLGLRMDPRSTEAFATLDALRTAAEELLRSTGFAANPEVAIAGETALYADVRALRQADFFRIALIAPLLIGVILWTLTRSTVQSLVLLSATLLTYLAGYGLTWLLFHQVYGLSGLNFHVDLMLFIIILSLGQDYNIFVVTRIAEERLHIQGSRRHARAIAEAVCKTGRVVSGCGLIMAASFGSMFAGSLMVLKETAVALALGILIDTFLIRPLLVPALLVLLQRETRSDEINELHGSVSPVLSRVSP